MHKVIIKKCENRTVNSVTQAIASGKFANNMWRFIIDAFVNATVAIVSKDVHNVLTRDYMKHRCWINPAKAVRTTS